MRETSSYTFRFRYLHEPNRLHKLLGLVGRMKREGVMLGESYIFFEDIYRITSYQKKVVISLYPYPTIDAEITSHLVPGHPTLVLLISDYPEQFVNVVNRSLSTRRVKERLAKMTPEEQKMFFEKMNCPHCDAVVDLTDMVKTPYIYCPYCESLFNKHGYLTSGGNQYKTCPQTGYFDRIDEHTDFKMYYLYKESGFHSHTYYCSDALAEQFFKENALKNLVFGVGAFVNLWEKIRASARRHPSFEFLTEGNVLAMAGKMQEADERYYKVLQQHPEHPGIYLNYALGYLHIGDEEKGLRYLRKSLDGCANYQPTKEVLKKYTWAEDID